MNIEKLVKGIEIHKAVGKVRENCVYAKFLAEVPAFLIADGAVEANADGSITLYAVECPATRNFSVYVCFEQVSEDNAHKVPGNYGAWSKDNGDTTLKVVDGKCYNLPATVKASLITEEVPAWVIAAGFPVERNGINYELTRTDWGGEVRVGRIVLAKQCGYSMVRTMLTFLTSLNILHFILTIPFLLFSMTSLFLNILVALYSSYAVSTPQLILDTNAPFSVLSPFLP